MDILLLDPDPDRRALISEAITWLEGDYSLHHADSPAAAWTLPGGPDIRAAIVGPAWPDALVDILGALRDRLPQAPLITYTRMSLANRENETALLDAGADLVFDQRMTATRIAATLHPLLVSARVREFLAGIDAMAPVAAPRAMVS
jgi:hypothetical protein